MNTKFKTLLASLATAATLLPAPSSAATSKIELDLAASESLLFVEQPLPAEATARNISHGGLYDPFSASVKWGPLSPETDTTLSFDLIAEDPSIPAADLTTAASSDTLQAEATDTVNSSYEEWLLNMYPESNTGAQILSLYYDGDRDELPNFAEYHLALDPTVPNPLSDFATYQIDPAGDSVVELSHRPNAHAFHVQLQQRDLANPHATTLHHGTAIIAEDAQTGQRFHLSQPAPFFFRFVYYPYPTPEAH